MKTFKSFFSISLCLIVFVAIMFTSCDKEPLVSENITLEKEVLPDPRGNFERDLIITDESGKNQIELTLYAQTADLLEYYQSTDFILKPLFKKVPDETDNIVPTQITEQDDSKSPIVFFIKNQQLEKGANGFNLTVKQKTTNDVDLRENHHISLWFAVVQAEIRVQVNSQSGCQKTNFYDGVYPTGVYPIGGKDIGWNCGDASDFRISSGILWLRVTSYGGWYSVDANGI